MRRLLRLAILGVTTIGVASAASAHRGGVDYDLPAPGILLEGIGVDRERGVFYVSGVNDGGDVYRGKVGTRQLERWYDSTGTTGRGIDVDDEGRVYVAGGPTGTLRVFSPKGTLLASVATGAAGSFLNDVRIGRDGTAYVTDSSLPKIWHVQQESGRWTIAEWLDVGATIPYTPSLTDFDLGGIVTTSGGKYLLTSQGSTGRLWRISIATKAVTEVDLGGATIPNADGIVLKGTTLWVVQNFARQISRFHLGRDASRAALREVVATPATKTFTTAKLAGERLLVVDSQFGFPPAAAPAEGRVVSMPTRPQRHLKTARSGSRRSAVPGG